MEGMDLDVLAAWMERIEEIALEHTRQQSEMREAISFLTSNVFANKADRACRSPVKHPEKTTLEAGNTNASWATSGPSASPVPSTASQDAVANGAKAQKQARARKAGSSLSLSEIGKSGKVSVASKMKSLMKPPCKGLSKKQDMAHDKEMPFWEGLVHSRAFEFASLLLVLANAAVTGWELQYNAVNHRAPAASGVFEVFFGVVFTAEILLRVVALGWEAFKIHWNLFDMFVVFSLFLEQVLNLVTGGDKTSTASAMLGQVPVLRMMRIVRLVRVLRVIRMVRFFRELRLMIMSIIVCMKSLCWAAVVMILMLYVFSISLTQGYVEYCRQHRWECAVTEPKLVKYFGGIDVTMLSLFEAMAGGISWGEFVDLLQPVGPLYVAIFLFYITFSILAVLNVVTGLFVDNAMKTSHDDQEALIQEEMSEQGLLMDRARQIFNAMDTDGSGTIGIQELYEALEDDRMVAFFHAMKLDISEVEGVFALIDREHKGQVDVDEFLYGFVSLKGQANSLDLHKVISLCGMILHKLIEEDHHEEVRFRLEAEVSAL